MDRENKKRHGVEVTLNRGMTRESRQKMDDFALRTYACEAIVLESHADIIWLVTG